MRLNQELKFIHCYLWMLDIALNHVALLLIFFVLQLAFNEMLPVAKVDTLLPLIDLVQNNYLINIWKEKACNCITQHIYHFNLLLMILLDLIIQLQVHFILTIFCRLSRIVVCLDPLFILVNLVQRYLFLDKCTHFMNMHWCVLLIEVEQIMLIQLLVRFVFLNEMRQVLANQIHHSNSVWPT